MSSSVGRQVSEHINFNTFSLYTSLSTNEKASLKQKNKKKIMEEEEEKTKPGRKNEEVCWTRV